jgi:hypothetical protein
VSAVCWEATSVRATDSAAFMESFAFLVGKATTGWRNRPCLGLAVPLYRRPGMGLEGWFRAPLLDSIKPLRRANPCTASVQGDEARLTRFLV